MKKKLTAFTWGYWGWGTSVEHFLEAAAAHEAEAGFEPPAFADVRLRRSVRAEDFKDNHFAKIVGEDRYRWFPGLGNAKIGTNERGIQIAKPEEAHALLDYSEAQAKANRRVLFFCACQWIMVEGKPACHRHTVADLLLNAATQRGLDLEVVEWPGGKPLEVDLQSDENIEKTLYNTAVAIGEELPDDLATLPWGTVVNFWIDDEHMHPPIVSGPAKFDRGQWRLPVWEFFRGKDDDVDAMKQRAREFRTSFGLEPRRSKK